MHTILSLSWAQNQPRSRYRIQIGNTKIPAFPEIVLFAEWELGTEQPGKGATAPELGRSILYITETGYQQPWATAASNYCHSLPAILHLHCGHKSKQRTLQEGGSETREHRGRGVTCTSVLLCLNWEQRPDCFSNRDSPTWKYKVWALSVLSRWKLALYIPQVPRNFTTGW